MDLPAGYRGEGAASWAAWLSDVSCGRAFGHAASQMPRQTKAMKVKPSDTQAMNLSSPLPSELVITMSWMQNFETRARWVQVSVRSESNLCEFGCG